MHIAFTSFLVFALVVGIASFVYHEIVGKVCLTEMEYEFDRTLESIEKKASALGVSAQQADVAFVLDCGRVAKAMRSYFSVWTLLLAGWYFRHHRLPDVELLSEKAPCFLSGSPNEITRNLVRCGFINSPVMWCVYKSLRLLHSGWKMMRAITTNGTKTAEYVISVEQQSPTNTHYHGGSLCMHR